MGLLRERKNRKLRGFPQPYSDETLSSWLFRCATSKKCAVSIEAAEEYVDDSLRNGVDYDFGFGETFKRLCTRFGMDYIHCKNYFDLKSRDMLLGVYNRNSFCRQCLDEDVRRRSTPYWRKSWCRIDVAYCLLHKTLLTTTREDFGLYRAWYSFAYFSDVLYESKGCRNVYEFVTLNLLALRVQNWLHMNRREIERHSVAVQLIRDLLRSFLSLRTEYRYCGLARVAFGYASQIRISHKHYHYSLCMYYGARNSSSTHRKAALIILGIVLGFYSDLELVKLKNTALYSCGVFPITASGIGVTVADLLDVPEKEWYISQFRDVSPISGVDINSCIAEFLSRMRGH